MCLFCAQQQIEWRIRRKTRRISRIVFLLFANDCMNLRNKNSIEGARRQISGSSNQSAFPGPTSQIIQSDCSDGLSANKSDCPIRSLGRTQDQQVRSSNQIALAGPTSRTDHLSVSTNQILPTDHLFCIGQSDPSYGPSFCIGQSDRLDGPSFRIGQSDPSYGPSFRIGQSDRSDGPSFCIG